MAKKASNGGAEGSVFRIGGKYLIRTVTNYIVGKVKKITATEILLGGASWVADTGRFHDCLKDGSIGEVEPIPGEGLAIVGRGAIVDAFLWEHNLPTQQK